MIGTVLKERMKALKLTQKELSKMALISQATLSEIINGKAQPKQSTIEALAEALSLPLDSLADTGEEWQNWPKNFACPRCGSRALSEFYNHADESVRISCGFCGLDTGEQKNRSSALRLLSSFVAPPPNSSEHATIAEMSTARVLTLTELLAPFAYDDNDVRPVWLENQGLFCSPALMQCGVAERERNCARFAWWNSFGMTSYDLDRYGYTWRCWTAKPTEAQSDAASWLL